MIMIGVQAMMLREQFASDGVLSTLDAVRELGYRAVEVSQVPMSADTVDALERARDELGIDIAALSAPLSVPEGAPIDSLDRDFDKIVGDAERLGARHIRIGAASFEALVDGDTAREYCAAIEEHGARLAEHGLTLSYHNHHFDFSRFDGQYLLDIIQSTCPHVALEVDVHWVQRGGLDPARTLARYGRRVALLHLKDYRIATLPAEALQRHRDGDTSAISEALERLVQFAEVGEGSLDFPAIIAEAENQGVEYAFVEQDLQYGRTPLQALRISHDNLARMGFSDRF